MLTKVEVYNERGTMLSLPLQNGSMFKVREIRGLEPVKADINTSKVANLDGEMYTGAQGGKRNIVLTLGLAPDYAITDVSGLRSMLYPYFMPKSKVLMKFYNTHMETVLIEGWVEDFATSIFSADPEVQISVICPDSAFYAENQTIVSGVNTQGDDLSTTSIDYVGTIPAGFLFTLKPTGVVNGVLHLYNTALIPEAFSVGLVGMTDTKELWICTVPGRKSVDVVDTTSGIHTSQLSTMVAGSTWMQLLPGSNNFCANLLGTYVAPWTLTYIAKYGGL